MSEIRENQLTGEWVIIAPERAKRGGNLAVAVERPAVPPYMDGCPFCVGHEEIDAERYRLSDEDGNWEIRSVVNKFSVLSASGEPGCGTRQDPGEESVNGVGLHEVIVESPRHDAALATSPVSHTRLVLDAYRERFLAFYQDPRVRHVIVFKNQGADAGASQQHPHSQIVGLPIVPGQVMERIERGRRYRAEKGTCLGCDFVRRELSHGDRVIAENEHFVAFIPYAALSPYHLWIFPKAHASCFAEQSPAMLDALAEVLRAMLAKVHGILGNPPFNLLIRSLGPAEKDCDHFHWYLSMVPRVNKSAGFELGTGMYVNPSLPEVCAKTLRDFAV